MSMRRIARTLILGSVALMLVVPVGGCSNSTTNEGSMSGTKGTAGPNPPTSQKEFYEQQKAANAENSKTKSKPK